MWRFPFSVWHRPAIVSFALTVGACSAPTEQVGTGEESIGPAGGTLVTDGLRIDFPPGAVTRPVLIKARKDDMFLSPGSSLPIFELEPHGIAFGNRPRMTIELDEAQCASGSWLLATHENGAWRPLRDSREERDASGCRVSAPVPHFSHFGALPDMLAAGLPQPVQNYFAEAVLIANHSHGAEGTYREYRPSDSLQTRGASRYVRDDADPFIDFCLIGSNPDLLADAETTLDAAVDLLTDNVSGSTHGLSARFLPEGCYSDADIAEFGACTLDCQIVQRNPGTVYVFLDADDGQACGPAQALPCYQNYSDMVMGGEIIGGLFWAVTPRSPAPTFSASTVRHELGHAFGLGHTWGDPDVMSYRRREADYAELEQQAFSVLYQLPTGLGLRDLIALGVIEDTPEVLHESPLIDRTEIHESLQEGRVASAPAERTLDRAFVGETIIVWGERLTLPFGSEFNSIDPLPQGFLRRPFGYAPPIVRFGSVELVASLDYDYQTAGASDAGTSVSPFNNYGAAVTGRLRVTVPAGPGSTLTSGSPLSVERYDGEIAELAGFTIETDIAPAEDETPLPVELDCTPEPGGATRLTWTLPSTYLDGSTAFNPANATTRLFLNGEPLVVSGSEIELPGTETELVDTELRHPRLTSLYQAFLVDEASGQVGVPSNVCRVAPRATGTEVTVFLLDTTGSMAEPRSDGTTRFEAMVGPLPSGVPRAFAALDEVFAGTTPPRVAIWSFDADRGLIDHVEAATGEVFTSDRAVAEDALLAIRAMGTDGQTPLVDNTCISGAFLLDEFENASADPATFATLRIFTDGEENFSVGVPECPSSCAGSGPGTVPWNSDCRPGTCPGSQSLFRQAPVNCTSCQLDLFASYCGSAPDGEVRLTFFVEYFGQGGPFSPLPPDSGYLLDLAQATQGMFVHNADDVTQSVGFLASDRPPTANAGELLTEECSGPDGALVTLQGTGSDEKPSSELVYAWVGPFGTLDGPRVNVQLPLGAHQAGLFVSDEHQTSLPSTATIVVEDTQAPTLAVALSPNSLWPPNHKFVRVRATIQASDVCDSGPIAVRLVSITSNEPENGTGDGDTAPDIRAADFGTDDREFELRAERSGAGSGRIYTVRYEAVDASGNSTLVDAQVVVPHDRSR